MVRSTGKTESEILILDLKITAQNLGITVQSRRQRICAWPWHRAQARTGYQMALSDYLEENGTVGHKIHRHKGARALGTLSEWFRIGFARFRAVSHFFPTK